MSGVTKEILSELYTDQNKTDKEIGSIYKVSDVAVSKWRKKFGILTKGQLARRNGQENGLDGLTPIQLANLYSSMGQRAIANRYGVSKPTVAARLEKFGIQAISKSERAISHQEFIEEQKEVCIGTILGDGHLSEKGVLKVFHYYGQSDYLLHIHKLLSPLTLPVFYEEKEMDNGRLTFGFGFRTVQHSWLQSLRSIFYPKGEKIYPTSILSSLSPRSLAYWYFDDGHLDSGLPSLDVGKLTDEQMSQLSFDVGKRFSLDVFGKIYESSGSCRILRIRAKSADAFFSLIRDFVPPDLLYKFPPKHWSKGVLPKLPTKTPDLKLLPKHLSDEAKQWVSLEADDKAGLLELFTTHWTQLGFPYHIPRPEELEILLRLKSHQVIQDGKIKIRQVGQGICQGICQGIWAASSYGSKSPLEVFSDSNLLRETLRFCLNIGEIPNQARLRAALRYQHKNGVYNFRPSAAKALVDRYCPSGGIVLDPCAGFGGRLLGSVLSSAKPTYIGYEPSSETYIGLRNLHGWICQYLPEIKDRVILYQQPAEDAEFPEKVDLILTSPPYWKRELYSSEITQSAVRYQDYEVWVEGFLAKILEKSVRCLCSGGWVILNVDDFNLGGKHYPLVSDSIHIMERLGFNPPEILTYLMPGGGGAEPRTESVLCWVKGYKTEYSSLSGVINLPKCKECGKTTSILELKEGTCSQCYNSITKTCWCGVTFRSRRKDHIFHDENCYARYKRTLYRQEHPVDNVRTFTCIKCHNTWKTSALGNFRFCPSCQDEREVETRKKICVYRHCGQPFVDTSIKNSMKFCCPEHQRREKMFKSGKAKDLSYFRDNKPKLDPLCMTCGKRFPRSPEDKSVRCLECREKARIKTCPCGVVYRDNSELNTRRYCYTCKPPVKDFVP